MPVDMSQEELRELLEKHIASTEELKETVDRTARYIKWLRIINLIKLVIILIPLIAAWLYLPQITEFFADVYGTGIPGFLQ